MESVPALRGLISEADALAEGMAAVVELLEQGLIEEKRIRASLARIAELKEKINGERTW